MKVNAHGPIKSLQGTYKHTDLVYFEKDGQFFARARVTPRNPQSQDQVLVRTFLELATKNWDTLTSAQRDAWSAYAEQYYDEDEAGRPKDASGISLYVKANSIRQLLGLALVTDAPTASPPSPVTELEQMTAQNPDTLGITIHHGLTVLAGHQVLVRMTPAMATVARKPRETDFRYVRGVNPQSAAPLQAGGSDYVFTPTRFLVDDGKRFGVSVRVVRTADGIVSRARFGDFVKVV